MGIFDRFPYSSTHEMNLDFMLGKATEIAEDMQQVTAGMEQVQAGLEAISEKTEQATQAAAQAAQSASSIEGSVTAAEEAAEEAQMHNESAQTWANNALTYKADCQRAATEAAASSSSAAQAATAAAASEDTVATYAQAANASAQSAANNNDSAHQYANQASASASNATFHSSNAQTAATNAQTAATRASALKDDCETLHRMCVTAVDLAGEQAVAAANSAAQAAASKTDVENLVESLPEDFTDLNNTVNQLSDEIVDVKSALNDVEETVFIESSFNPSYQSGWIRTDGTLGNASDACRTGYLNLGSSNIIITPKTGYKIKVAEYNNINASSTFTRFLVGPDAEAIVARFESISGKYYIVQISSVDGSAVTESNIPVDAITVSYIKFTDKTLLIPDKAADAKTVGDKFTELWRDVETIHNEIGYGDISFAVTAGVNHSGGSDVLSINIPAGEKFHVVFSGNVSSPQIYARYSDGTNSRLITGFTYDGVAAKDITAIGVFISGSAIPLDTTVKTVAYTTESIYGKTTRIPDEKTIITTVLGADLPGDISGYGVSSAYAAEMKNAIDAWMGDYAGDTKKVPFIVHTDQHGRLTAARQGIFNLLNWMVNWEGISAIFNLGDTVVDHWENDNTNANPLLRNATLEDARICTKNIPDNKQINVYGNHDTWYSGTLETAVSGVLPSLQYNNPYFASDGLITKMLDDNSGMKVIYDVKNNVKYLVVAGWDYADKPSGNIGYQLYWINKSHLEWIVSQMAENDGYDLVLVSHVPLEMNGTGSIDPVSETGIESANPIYITHGTSYLLPLWNARKAKTAGSIVYNGETITFDFTACEKDCLCALAGHTHRDGVEYLDGTGLLQVAFDWFANDTIHFGIIDRRNNKIKCWKLSNDNNTPSVDAWEKSFSAN